MGQDFTAILGHRLKGNTLIGLPHQLDEIVSKLGKEFAVARLDTVEDSPKNWIWGWDKNFDPDFDAWIEAGDVSLRGPGSLSMEFGQHSISFRCWVRWREFVLDETIRRAMRTIVHSFCDLFGSEIAIYVPDSSSSPGETAQNLVSEGASVSEILEQLSEWGRAAPSIASIASTPFVREGKSQPMVEGEGYYVDRFEDAAN